MGLMPTLSISQLTRDEHLLAHKLVWRMSLSTRQA